MIPRGAHHKGTLNGRPGPPTVNVGRDERLWSVIGGLTLALFGLSLGFITTSGQVLFNALPHGGTEVTVVVQYVAPGGKTGQFLANAVGRPERRLAEDLRRFKALAEGMANRQSGAEWPR